MRHACNGVAYCIERGREGGREGREEGREGGREGRREGRREEGREGCTRTLGSVVSPFLRVISTDSVFLRKIVSSPLRINFSAAVPTSQISHNTHIYHSPTSHHTHHSPTSHHTPHHTTHHATH